MDRFGDVPAPELSMRRGLGLDDGDFVVLSVGELNDNKNHATVIRALAQLDDPRMHYLICGNGPRRQQLQELVRELDVGERVHFLGYRRDIPDMLAMADVFCLPSFREGLPLSVMEAMASGTPVVCSRIRGAEDLIDPGQGGVLVTPADSVDGFADALGSLSADSGLRAGMGAHNRQRVTGFSTDAVTASLRDVYGFETPADTGRR